MLTNRTTCISDGVLVFVSKTKLHSGTMFIKHPHLVFNFLVSHLLILNLSIRILFCFLITMLALLLMGHRLNYQNYR